MTYSEIKEMVEGLCTYAGQDCWLLTPDCYSVNGTERFPVLVAHLDTVHDDDTLWSKGASRCAERSAPTVFHDPEHDVYWSPDGLGADDHAGVYAVLKIFFELPDDERPIVIITDGEEYGGIGAKQVFGEFFSLLSDRITYLIELDRRGIDDCVFYNWEPKEFKDIIKGYGFKEMRGSFSDISTIGEDFDTCGVNLSIGFMNEHHESEHLYASATEATIEKVKEMVKYSLEEQKHWINKREFTRPTFSANTGVYGFGDQHGVGYDRPLTGGNHFTEDMDEHQPYDEYDDDYTIPTYLDSESFFEDVAEYCPEYEDRDGDGVLYWCYYCDIHYGPQVQGVETEGLCPMCGCAPDYMYLNEGKWDIQETPPAIGPGETRRRGRLHGI